MGEVVIVVLSVVGATLVGGGLAALDAKNPSRVFCMFVSWPITLPVLCWRELSPWLFPDKPYCENCGKKRKNVAKFCGHCGKPLA